MFMSLFSSFDAFCAESLGKRFSLSSSATGAKNQLGSPAVVVSDSERKAGWSVYGAGSKVKEGSSSSPDANKSQDHHHHQLQHKRRPRFAVELDGLHCFETIISS